MLALGALVGTPLGAAVLVFADPLALRWGVTLTILALLGLLVSGWRFHGRPTVPATLGVGLAGGVLGGVAMVSGPPVMAWLLGQPANARQVRASFGLYLAAGGVLAGITYAVAGLLTLALARPSWWRRRSMASASARRAYVRPGQRAGLPAGCFAMIALAALLSLPLWDGLL